MGKITSAKIIANEIEVLRLWLSEVTAAGASRKHYQVRRLRQQIKDLRKIKKRRKGYE